MNVDTLELQACRLQHDEQSMEHGVPQSLVSWGVHEPSGRSRAIIDLIGPSDEESPRAICPDICFLRSNHQNIPFYNTHACAPLISIPTHIDLDSKVDIVIITALDLDLSLSRWLHQENQGWLPRHNCRKQ